MASTNFALEAIKAQETNAMREMIAALKIVAPHVGNDALRAHLERAEKDIGMPQQPTVKPRVDIVFDEPEDSLEQWTSDLRTTMLRVGDIELNVEPTQGIHFVTENGSTYKNVRKASWLVDEIRVGYRYRDTLLADHAKATERARIAARNARDANDASVAAAVAAITAPTPDELQAEYERGALYARWYNEKARSYNAELMLLKRRLGNDIRGEDSLVRYLPGKKDPDWYHTVRNLKSFGAKIGYTKQHYKSALDRFVSFFSPDLAIITEHMQANGMATFLSSLTLPEPEFELIENRLKNLVRQPGAPIHQVMSHLLALADLRYKDTTATEKPVLVEKLMVTGLTCFLTGEPKAEIIAAIEHCKRQQIPISWEKLTDAAARSESKHGLPAVALRLTDNSNTSALTYNVGTLVNTGVRGVGPLVQVGFDSDWAPTQIPPPRHPGIPFSPPPAFQKAAVPPPPAADGNGAAAALPAPPAAPPAAAPHREIKGEEQETIFVQNKDGSVTPFRVRMDTRNSASSSAESEVFDDPDPDFPATPAAAPAGQPRRSERKTKVPDRYQSDVHSSDLIDAIATHYFDKGRRSRDEEKKKEKSSFPKKSGSRDNSRSKDKNKDRKSNQFDRKRSDSTDRSRSSSSHRSDSKPSSKNRFGSKDRDKKKSTDSSRDHSRRSRSREKDKSKSSQSDKPRSRSRSQSSDKSKRSRSWSDDQMEKGLNCSLDYDPKREKRCLKCLTERNHHEFQCPKFHRRSKFNCKMCNRGFHWPDECDQEPPNPRGNR